NPYIDFKTTPFYVQQEFTSWQRPKIEEGGVIKEYPRRAGMSSFGAGGANAHVILEEYDQPLPQSDVDSQEPHIVVLSAKNEERLKIYAGKIVEFLERQQATEQVSQPVSVAGERDVRVNLQQDLLSIVSEILQVKEENIDIDEVFSEYGVGTIGLTELSQRINDRYQIETTPVLFSEYSTIKALAQHLYDTYRDHCSSFSQSCLKESAMTGSGGNTIDLRNSPSPNPSHQGRGTFALADFAYTLQVGREAMEERLAIVVSNLDEVKEQLRHYAQGEAGIQGIHQGNVKANKAISGLLIEGEEGQTFVQSVIQRKKLDKLAQFWVLAINIDWNLLHPTKTPRHIPLPTYPFAKERYWIDDSKSTIKNLSTCLPTGLNPKIQWLHPLVHQNTSDFSEQRFSSTFTGQEFFLANHVVKGHRVLPGAASLEMAREAVERAVGVLQEERTGIRLNNVVWTRPVVVGEQPVQVHIGLFPEENGEISFEIYEEEESGSAIVNCQGHAAFDPITDIPSLNLPALQAECSRETLSSDQLYGKFRIMGLDYGPGHQGIEKAYVGNGQVLAKLSLPPSVSTTQQQFVLHPSLMDSALQASIGVFIHADDLRPLVPFALQELQMYRRCTPDMWVWLRYSESGAAGTDSQQFNLDVCDESGTICVRMTGLDLRRVAGDFVQERQTALAASATFGTVMLKPDWKEQPLAADSPTPDYAQYVVILCEAEGISQEQVEASIEGVRCLTLQAEDIEIDKRFETYAIQVFEEIQRIFKRKSQGKVFIQIVVSTQHEQQLFSGLSGLLKTAQLEHPKLIGQLIGMELREDAEELIEKLMENSRSPIDLEIRYQEGKRYVAGWSEIETSQEAVDIPWKNGSIYLITGGAGGLGLIFAKEIAQQAKEVTLIFTGRSRLNEGKQAQLKEFKALDVRVEYKQVDVTEKEAVTSLFQSIQEEFGSLNGIIHCAGVIRDNFILKKMKEELEEVLAPKVSGVMNLDEASKDLPLDFFIVFSSVVGAMGNPGQADYACANAFLDAYARYRNAMVASRQRQGHTLSINWPLWKEGGMRVDDATEKLMRQRTGMIALQTSTGIRALYQGLASSQSQVMVLEGTLPRMKQTLLSLTTPSTPKSGAATEIDTGSLVDKVQATLMHAVSELLKVNIEDIDADAELNDYGCDPITLTEFANTLNQDYQLDLTPTIFFDHPTLRSVAEYLAEEYQDVFVQRFQTESSKTPSPEEEQHLPSFPQGGDLAVPAIGQDVLQEKAANYFKKLLSAVIKLPAHRIDAEASMEKYGIDSIMVMDLTNQLEHTFGSLPKTLFFEYQNIQELTGYFLEFYRDQLIELLGIGEKPEASPQYPKDSATVTQAVKSAGRRHPRFVSFRSASREEHRIEALDIAIIGLSGRYPQARNIQEFWENLRDGKDCITEIPQDRWDHRLYFDAEKHTPGKTYSKWGGFLDGVDHFDPLFFNISPREAELMDPQERLFLECAFATLEDAGYTRKALGLHRENSSPPLVGNAVELRDSLRKIPPNPL
ncbi:MAG: SDR family NAD(P)-dependent oxidoreductase, partial [Gammaproteobacteria bacterium]|nr:SDR family NAD(P)-dependent oxidoreductase [Gammaproteobacteria bacterium]